MATGLSNLSDYYTQWGGALGSAAGGLLGGAVTTSTDYATNSLSVVSGTDQYVYPYQQFYNNIGIDFNSMLQTAQQSVQKPIDKAKNILESLRDEISNWCASALEVA